MKVKLIFEDQILYAILDDRAAAKSFYDLLPLELALNDYASTEKISDLPKKLDIHNEPKGYKPKVGDITYYAPWGNLALFYKNFDYSNGLVRLGEITGNIEILKKSKSLSVRIEVI
ncbi:cyclophilin-like fold protein [Acinetobacter courvalinii]|uniref:cyclophilin-like fold protein n=1 Tax=Acinetobacter courvalinii TaxID=280147 RepID=UPI003F56A806